MEKCTLSRARRNELMSAFKLFDSEHSGLLNYTQLRFMLKSIGVQLRQADYETLRLEHESRGKFSFEDVLSIGEQVYNDEAMESAIMSAIREISPKDLSKVPTSVLKNQLLTLGMGIVLSEEEVDMFLTVYCDPDKTGYTDVETFTHRVLRD